MIIDRFEGEYAVVETEDGMININRSFLPAGAREGDSIVCENGKYSVDKETTVNLHNAVKEKLSKLLKGEND